MRAVPLLFCSHVAEIGGAEAVLVDLVEALDRTRFEPHFAGPADGPLPRRLAAADVRLHVVPFTAGGAWRKAAGVPAAARAVRRIAATTGAPLVVATSMIAGYAGVLAQHHTLRCVWHLHIVPHAWVARVALRRAHAVLAPSRAALATLGERWRRCGRGTVVQNGVADRFFTAVPLALHAQLGLPATTPLLGIVGRLDPHKGHDVLLDAVAALPATLQPHVVVAGGELFTSVQARVAGYGERLRARVRTLGLDGRVHWLGDVRDPAPLFGALDVVVVPSTTLESAPRAIAEAQAAGTTVVASAIGGTTEMITDDTTGVLVAPGDPHALATALARVLGDAPLRRRLATAARAFADSNYRLATFARRCEQALHAALGAAQRPGLSPEPAARS